MIIIINGESHLFEKSSEKEAYNNYYDDSVEKFTVSIDVDFKKNMLFNKCDITLNLYDKEEYFEHGENKTITIELPKGTHKLKFSGNDDVDIIKLEIDGNTKVKYKLECLSGGIEVSQVSKSNYDNNDN
jgi:regulation of enolase protein 1 (concanavalin A-like superfamily)